MKIRPISGSAVWIRPCMAWQASEPTKASVNSAFPARPRRMMADSRNWTLDRMIAPPAEAVFQPFPGHRVGVMEGVAGELIELAEI